MGSFSWNKADKLTAIENVAYGSSFKFLIPKEFGGGFIKDKYQDYGYLGTKEENGQPRFDMYELLAFWNSKNVEWDYDYEKPLMKEIDQYTRKNRSLGIDIGCYDQDIEQLKYPLKLVSSSFKGTYEDLETCSFRDPDQGFFPRKRKINMGFNINKEITTKMTWEDLARDEYYKLYNSGMFWEFFPNLSGDYLQDKEFFLNFIAERENKKEYFTLISSK